MLAYLQTISAVSLRRALRLASAAHNHRRRSGTLPSTIPSRRHTHPHLSSPRPAKLHRKPLPLLCLNALEVHLAQHPEGQDDPEGESGGKGGDPVDHICIVTEEMVGWLCGWWSSRCWVELKSRVSDVKKLVGLGLVEKGVLVEGMVGEKVAVRRNVGFAGG